MKIINIALALLLLLSGLNTGVFASHKKHKLKTDTKITVEGIFTVAFVTNDTSANNQSGIVYRLIDNKSKKLYHLQFQDESIINEKDFGKEIEVTGYQDKNNILVESYKTKLNLSNLLYHVDNSHTDGPVRGDKNFAVVEVNFNDKNLTIRRNQIAELMFSNNPVGPIEAFLTADIILPHKSVKSFYEYYSGDLVTMHGDHYGPITLHDSYTAECNDYLWSQEVDSALESQGMDLSHYDYVLYVIPDNYNCNYGGVAFIGEHRSFVKDGANTFVYHHEVGHLLGMAHASSLAGSLERIEYGDDSDTMGSGDSLNAVHLDQMQWTLVEANILETETSGEFNIGSIDIHNYSGLKVIKTPFTTADGEEKINYVSFRTETASELYRGYDDGVKNKVCLHTTIEPIFQSIYPNSLLLGCINIGESVTDPDTKLRVTYLSLANDIARIKTEIITERSLASIERTDDLQYEQVVKNNDTVLKFKITNESNTNINLQRLSFFASALPIDLELAKIIPSEAFSLRLESNNQLIADSFFVSDSSFDFQPIEDLAIDANSFKDFDVKINSYNLNPYYFRVLLQNALALDDNGIRTEFSGLDFYGEGVASERLLFRDDSPRADLSTQVFVDKSTINTGDTFTLEFQVRNNPDSAKGWSGTAYGVVGTMEIPEGLTPVSVDRNCSIVKDKVSTLACNFSTLSPGAMKRFYTQFKADNNQFQDIEIPIGAASVTATSTVLNQISVDPNSSNNISNTLRVLVKQRRADLSILTFTPNKTTYLKGEEVVLTVIANNNIGTGNAVAYGVVLRIPQPDFLVFDPSKQDLNQNCALVNKEVVCQLVNLSLGAVARRTIRFSIPINSTVGIRNITIGPATVSATSTMSSQFTLDPNISNNSRTVNIRTTTAKPGSFTLNTPTGLTTARPSFSWTASSDVSSYNIMIKNKTTNRTVYVDTPNTPLTSTNFTVSSPGLPDATYTITVTAKNAAGNTPISRDFTILTSSCGPDGYYHVTSAEKTNGGFVKSYGNGPAKADFTKCGGRVMVDEGGHSVTNTWTFSDPLNSGSVEFFIKRRRTSAPLGVRYWFDPTKVTGIPRPYDIYNWNADVIIKCTYNATAHTYACTVDKKIL